MTLATIDLDAVSELRARLQEARRPVVVLGLEARAHTNAVREFIESYGCSVLTTYKAKGVVPDQDSRVLGIFTGGVLEADAIAASDLMILIGLDPVELILQPWSYQTPVVEISTVKHAVHYVTPSLSLIGSISEILHALCPVEGWNDKHWISSELESIRSRARSQLGYSEVKRGVAPDRIVQLGACRTLHKSIVIDRL